MTEYVVFNEWAKDQLVEQGFELLGSGEITWYFEDSVLLVRAVSELLEQLEKGVS